jgi:hypothetical protein
MLRIVTIYLLAIVVVASGLGYLERILSRHFALDNCSRRKKTTDYAKCGVWYVTPTAVSSDAIPDHR